MLCVNNFILSFQVKSKLLKEQCKVSVYLHEEFLNLLKNDKIDGKASCIITHNRSSLGLAQNCMFTCNRFGKHTVHSPYPNSRTGLAGCIFHLALRLSTNSKLLATHQTISVSVTGHDLLPDNSCTYIAYWFLPLILSYLPISILTLIIILP